MQSASTDPSSAAALHLKTKDLSATNSSEESASGSPRDPINMSFVDALDTEGNEGVSQPPPLFLNSLGPETERGDGAFVGDVLTDCEMVRIPGNGSVATDAPTGIAHASLTVVNEPPESQPYSVEPLSGACVSGGASYGISPQNSHERGTSSATTNRVGSTTSHTNATPSSAATINIAANNDSAISGSQTNIHSNQPRPRNEHTSNQTNQGRVQIGRRSSLGFFSNWASSIRGNSNNNVNGNNSGNVSRDTPGTEHAFMSNSPTIANLSSLAGPGTAPIRLDNTLEETEFADPGAEDAAITAPAITVDTARADAEITEHAGTSSSPTTPGLDGLFSVRLTPIIDHSSASSGLYFSPVIRKIKPNETIAIGRYTEKNKSAAHAPQGSSRPIVFKSKVVSRTHALLQCRSDGLWFLKDCKSSSGTFLNNVRLSQATMELTYWPVVDGDTIQLGLDYRGGAEDIYRCVKMRCEFNHSWQRKVNQYNLEIHERMKNLHLETDAAESKKHVTECAICLMTLDPCQALFISPCSHSWHYKCIRPVIIKSYPQFYCPNCRSMCDLETDIEDEF